MNAPGSNEGTFTAPDGGRVGYARYGREGGIPALYQGGTFGSRRQARGAHEIAEEMGIDILSLDPRGRGLSDGIAEYDVRAAVGQTRAALDAMGWDRAILVGASGGSIPSLAAAHALPDRTEGVLLLSPLGPVSDPGVRRRLPWKNRLAFEAAEWELGRKVLSLVFGKKLKTFGTDPDRILAELVGRFGPADRRQFAESASMRETLHGCLEDIASGRDGARSIAQTLHLAATTPWERLMPEEGTLVRILHGRHDAFVPLAVAQRVRDRLNAQLTVVDGGHFTALRDENLRLAFEMCGEMAGVAV